MYKKITIMTLFMLSLALVLSMPFAAHALDFKKERLANGLTLIHVERHELPIVMATLLIKASPLQEDGTKAGTAYLTAKMLSEGTAKRKSADISEQIEFMGASLDTSVNDDYTTVSLAVLKKDVETGFDLFSDIVLHPAFSMEELTRRKTLLAGSLKKRQEEPSFIAGRELIKNLFGDFHQKSKNGSTYQGYRWFDFSCGNYSVKKAEKYYGNDIGQNIAQNHPRHVGKI